MITLTAIIMFVLFLKLIGFVFGAGMRVFGWLLGGLGFIFSIILRNESKKFFAIHVKAYYAYIFL